jgi:osmotically-inducible protein OsmY
MSRTTSAPKTDEELKTQVVDELAWDTRVDASKVQVRVENGWVTLRGSVPTHWEKTEAARLAGNARGVLSVRNELAVVPSETVGDEVTGEEIVAALERSALVSADQVDVTVSDGLVTLRGTVPSAAARQAAHRAASRTAGVVDVVNDLTVSL